MKSGLNAPIEYDAMHRGHYYAKSSYRIPMGFSGADELLALGMAKGILTLYRNTPIYDAARHLLDCITAPLVMEDNSEWYESRVVVPHAPSAPVPPDVWNLITTALRENRVLTNRYSTDTLRASAMRNASSALGMMFLLFQEEKVPLGFCVFRYSHSKLVCCRSTSFLTIFQKNSTFILSYYDIPVCV